MDMKKFYESPDFELCALTARDNMMVSVSDEGYGWSDEGPVQNINPVS